MTAAPGLLSGSTPEIEAPDPRAAPGRRNRFLRGGMWSLLVVVIVFTIGLRLPAFFVPVFNSDETFLATQAQVIEDGGNLYHDAADRKPPLVPYIYAATFETFDTHELWSVRLVAMGAVALTAMLLALEARRRYGLRAAWMAGLLCVFALIAFAPQDGQAANFEIFMLPAMAASVLLARRGRATASGVAVAVATLAKQTGAATLLPVLYLVWKAHGRKGVVRALAGFGIPLALVALAMGPRQLVYWTVLGNGSYVGLRTATTSVLTMLVVMSLAWVACNLPIVWRLPQAWRERRLRGLDGGHDLDLWLWTASAALSVMVGLRFFGHYYLQLVPPLCLLSAGALSRATRRTAKGTVAFAAIAAVAFSAAGYFLHPFGQEPHYQSVSAFLEETTKPSDRILVWGSVPEIYWASDRRPATRFPTTLTFLANNNPGRSPADAAPENSSPQVWEWFFEDLAAHPPTYIVDTSPADIRGAQWTPISRFPRLQSLVNDQYEYVLSIDKIAVYRRK